MSATPSLVSLIRTEIEQGRPITFARYMELSLYAPGVGYYERQREIGRRGDFFTSVSVGPLFGELLAFQFAQSFARAGSGPVQIVEAGAHQGVLAADILAWMRRRRPDLLGRLEYCLVEPSGTRRAWQATALRPWLSHIKWVDAIAVPGGQPAMRIIFCNELLDAMPAHRCVWNAAGKKWEECRVGWDGEKFVWERAALPPGLAASLPAIDPELAAVLPDGYIVEHSTSAVDWWRSAARALGQGILLTIDYGLTGGELFRPERREGTLRAYSRHHAGGDLLERPGEADITAHVNFSAIEAAGRDVGLKTESLIGQEKFLAQILEQIQCNPESFDPWTPAHTKQFQTLTHPEHLGRAFRVLIQSHL